jgi:hypothetical protein
MSRPTAPFARAGLARQAGCGITSELLAALMLLSAPALAEPASLYPPSSLFRSLQLTALACGRDNDAANCDKARAMADPLLDHPRLSATCKDTLWAIRERARAAAGNSPERRDGIDRAAKDVTVFCRQPARPASASGSGTAGPGGGTGSSMFSTPAPR